MNASAQHVSRELILGIGGGISAYKSCDLLRRLQERGFLITVAPTRNSYNFVGKTTWEALSGRAVFDDMWSNAQNVPHVSLAKQAEVVVIAPATADLIAKLATGRADDALTSIALTTTSPIVLVPAMHSEMWLNPATVSNIEILRNRGIFIVEPESGKLTSGDIGVGRYPETEVIIKTISEAVGRHADLVGRNVLVSAGGTREFLDPVRYIGNLSSGKQGIAIAEEAVSRGATVTLVIANAPETTIGGVDIVHVSDTAELLSALDMRFDRADIVVMAAAVSDARPMKRVETKIEKSDLGSIELIENPDVIGSLSSRKSNQFVIGFAAQTNTTDMIEKAKAKVLKKGLDLIYANDVSDGKIFGKDETQGILLDSQGNSEIVNTVSKKTLAKKLLSIANDKLG